MAYVTGTQILVHVGVGTGTAAEQAWAQKCADAIEGAIATRLDTGGVTPNASGIDELEVAALTDGAALYNSKAAPNGILSAFGPDGVAVRMGADSLRAVLPVIRRIHPTAGIGIG
jgi:hypothetical protein